MICAFEATGNYHRPVAWRLAEAGFPEGLDSVLVMLDAQDTYQRFADQAMHIYWGAYIGTSDEVLIAGPLAEVAETIRTRRAELREQHGWIMDSYLLRRCERDANATATN